MIALRCLFALLILVGVGFSAGPAQEKKVVVTPVKYDGLKEEILKHRGKVVLVDFWATNCGPCKEAMPHYVEMQKKYADQGLIIVAVSVDPIAKLARAGEIMTEFNAPFRNLLLDEPADMWTKKFESTALPFAYVFDRRGKWVRFRSFDYQGNSKEYGADIDKTVQRMLSEK